MKNLQLKKVFVFFSFLLFLTFSLNLFSSDAQTGRGKTAPDSKTNKGPRMVGLPAKAGIDYSNFKHETHSLNCSECHFTKEVEEGKKAVTWPEHAACDECHNIAQFRLGAPKFCIICHTGPQNNYAGLKPEYNQKVKSDFGTKFPHDNKHVNAFAETYDKKKNRPIFDTFEGDDQIKQNVVKESGCIECHVKDPYQIDMAAPSTRNRESMPNHPECARCHSEALENKVKPFMKDCIECHKPWLNKQETVSNLFLDPEKGPFLHNDDHEKDSRPRAIKTKEDEKTKKLFLTKDGKRLRCQFCHEVDPVTSVERLIDIKKPLESRCTVCHSKKANAYELPEFMLARLRKDPPPKEEPKKEEPKKEAPKETKQAEPKKEEKSEESKEPKK